MKIDYLINIIQNIVNVGSQFQFNIYDALKMDNVEMDTNKINGIARVSGGSVEPIKDLGNAQLSMEIEFIYPYERNDFVKQHLIDTSTKTAGLVVQNSTVDPNMIGSTGVDIIFPVQGNYAIKSIGETMRCFIICYFDINEKSVLANDVRFDIQKGFQYNAVEVDGESEGTFYVERNIQAGDVTNITCKAEPIQPTITEYDTIGIDFVYAGNNLGADYGFVGNQKCFRVGYPETEEYYGKDFYSWNSGVFNNVAFGEGWNRYKQYKDFNSFSSLISNPFGTSIIISIVEKDNKIYCGGGGGKFAIYDISTGTFGDLVPTPFENRSIISIVEKDNKIYCGGGGGKFAIYDISTDTFGDLVPTPFGNDNIRSMLEKDNKIYCGGGGRFAIYDITTGTFGDLIPTPFGTFAIWSMVEKDNKIYCGTYNGKFAIYDILSGTFGSLISNPFETYYTIRSMVEKDDKIYIGADLFVGTGFGKFAIYDISTGTFGSLITTPFGISDIYSMVEKDNKIYIGADGGKFAIYDISTGTFGDLISTPFGISDIYSMVETEDKIYCGGGDGKFATYVKQLIIETTTPPTYEDVYILSSNMWQVMSDLIEYSGADRYLELQLPQDYADNRYEEFYEKEILWENVPYFKNIITRHRLSNTNKYMNSKEMQTINNGQSLDFSLAVPSIKDSVINNIKDDLLIGTNLNKGYNIRIYDESGYKYFNDMVVSGDFEEELVPGNSVILKIMFVYKRA